MERMEESKIIQLGGLEIAQVEPKIRGRFNRDLLVNTYFEHTDLFSPAANKFLKEGKYCGEPFNSKKFNIFWQGEKERCVYGYTNPVTKLWIPGEYYFFLNYKQMKMVDYADKNKKMAKRIISFPRFWPIHYFFMQDWHLAKENGMNMAILKPRGTGFSELLSSIGTQKYTFEKETPVFFFVSNLRYLNKDGVLSKSWAQMDFLNESTERAFKHLRQVKNNDLHRKASKIDPETRTEKNTGGEIIGAVVDNPRKVRGARGWVNFEEGGSFPDLVDSWMTAKALAEESGVKFAMMLVWGCVRAGTKVWTHDGRYINVEDLQQEDGIIGYDGKGISKEPIIGLNPPQEKLCYRIELENGLSLECSEDHPLLWSNESLRPHGKSVPRKVKFIRADQVKPGEHLMVINEVPIFGTNEMRDARLIGLLIGDGNYSKGGSIKICGCDEEVLEFIEKNYNYHENREQYNVSDGRLFKDYNLRGLAPYLKQLGIYGQTKQDKRLPLNLHTYNKESIAELLGGYFDADGAVRNDLTRGVSIVLTSISKDLLEEVKTQLIKFGVHSTILTENPKGGFGEKKDDRHLVYRLYINRHTSILNFQKNIKLLCKHKQDKIDKSLTQVKKSVKNVENAEFIFDGSTGKGAYFINKKDLGGMQLYKILSVEYIGIHPIYNLNAGTTHTYLANNLVTANTGGEQGDGITGLEDIFTHPAVYDCLPFENCWEDAVLPNDHGFFFPAWASMTKYMDKWGNTDFALAQEYHNNERAKAQKGSNITMDKQIAEFPFNPSEALMRLSGNPFPVEKLQKQLRHVDSSPDLKGVLKIGELDIADGQIYFKLNPKLDPVNHYPHKSEDILEGAVTIYEAPLKDVHGKVPDNLYYIVADCFYVDTEQAVDWNSLGSYYVYKRSNSLFPSEDDILVAWYAGRPPRVKDFHRRVFMAARYYNAIVQTEIKGGGNDLLNYAKEHSFVNYCGDRPTVFNQDKEFKKVSGRQFFVQIEKSNKPELLQKLVDWLTKERSLGLDTEKARYVLNLERIYDRALLEELIKFNPNGNFDRISCLLVLMMIHQEAELQAIEATYKNDRNHLFSRNLFTGTPSSSQWTLAPDEMIMHKNLELHKTGTSDLIM